MSGDKSMRTLIVGAGALGGLIAARLYAAGRRVWLATRTTESAAILKTSGLEATGVGGTVVVESVMVEPLEAFASERFDLIVLATKAHDALAVLPSIADMLADGGTILPIQNGGVSQIVADRLDRKRVLGGLSNIGATMIRPGLYEQRNAGHLLVGELGGGSSRRADRVREWLGGGVAVRITTNMAGAVWSKLLVNCSVTTIGAIAARTMREYIALPEGRALFERTYDEALSVAKASGATPERMLVDPVPPGGRGCPGGTHHDMYERWLEEIVHSYGDLKPSMLQDFERGRPTEVDFINGYVLDLGRRLGVPVPANAAIVQTVHAITEGRLVPDAAVLGRVLRAAQSSTD
jgi:2-dehydropantoate 2-reductase